MPEIAIVRCIEISGEYSNEVIAQSITNWDVVTEEELKLLRAYRDYGGGNYHIVYRVDTQKTVKDCIAWAASRRKREEDRKKKEERAAKLAKEKREAKKREKEKALFEKMKKLYEVGAN